MNLHTIHHAIHDLLHEVDTGRLAEPVAMASAAQRIQAALACTWVSFDRLSGQTGQRVMQRLLAYHGSGRLVTTPGVQHEATGGYFGPLVQRGFYACADTLADPAFAPVADAYLRPRGIRALMTAAFPAPGTQGWYAMTCASDQPRRWRAEEVTALRRCASAARARRGGPCLVTRSASS